MCSGSAGTEQRESHCASRGTIAIGTFLPSVADSRVWAPVRVPVRVLVQDRGVMVLRQTTGKKNQKPGKDDLPIIKRSERENGSA